MKTAFVLAALFALVSGQNATDGNSTVAPSPEITLISINPNETMSENMTMTMAPEDMDNMTMTMAPDDMDNMTMTMAPDTMDNMTSDTEAPAPAPVMASVASTVGMAGSAVAAALVSFSMML